MLRGTSGSAVVVCSQSSDLVFVETTLRLRKYFRLHTSFHLNCSHTAVCIAVAELDLPPHLTGVFKILRIHFARTTYSDSENTFAHYLPINVTTISAVYYTY